MTDETNTQDQMDGWHSTSSHAGAVQFVHGLNASLPPHRNITHQDVVKALNLEIDKLKAELDAERAKNNPSEDSVFYQMIIALDSHRHLLMLAQGNPEAIRVAIDITVKALMTYKASLEESAQ